MRLAIWWIKLDQNQVSTKLVALSPQIEFSQHAMSAKQIPSPIPLDIIRPSEWWIFFLREGIYPNRIHPNRAGHPKLQSRIFGPHSPHDKLGNPMEIPRFRHKKNQV